MTPREALHLPGISTVLEELCRIVDSASPASDKLGRALETIARRLGMRRGAICLLAPGTADIHIEIAYGLKPIEQSRGHYRPGEGVTGMVIQSARAIIVPDVADEPLFLNRTRARNLQREHITFFCVPLIVDDQAQGAMWVERERLVPEQEQQVLHLLGVAASLLAPHARLHQLAAHGQHAPLMGSTPSAAATLPADMMIGTSPALRLILARITQLAPLPEPVLICGEAGSGKELAARALHAARYGAALAARPFVTLDCAALPDEVLMRELFGPSCNSAPDALTGRDHDSSSGGRWELALGGTLFLDEIGELSPCLQARLLERLCVNSGPQNKTHSATPSDQVPQGEKARLVAASSRKLSSMVARGAFSAELFARLSALTLTVPPLRERRHDILPLANHFLDRSNAVRHGDTIRLSLSAMDLLHRHPWPGNIRELEQLIERAVLLVGGDGLILPHHLPPELHAQECPACGRSPLLGGYGPVHDSLPEHLEALERAAIADALEHADGHMGHAAAALGLTERVMALRMKKYGLRYQDYRATS